MLGSEYVGSFQIWVSLTSLFFLDTHSVHSLKPIFSAGHDDSVSRPRMISMMSMIMSIYKIMIMVVIGYDHDNDNEDDDDDDNFNDSDLPVTP